MELSLTDLYNSHVFLDNDIQSASDDGSLIVYTKNLVAPEERPEVGDTVLVKDFEGFFCEATVFQDFDDRYLVKIDFDRTITVQSQPLYDISDVQGRPE